MTAAALAAAAALVGAVLLLLPRSATPRVTRVLAAGDNGVDRGAGSGRGRGLGDRVERRARDLAARVRLGAAGRRRAATRRARALDTAAALAAELRAGQPVRSALVRAAEAHRPPVCPAAAGAAAWGGDVPAALRADARTGGLPLLRGLAACWEVGESSGAGLAASVERLVESARAAEDVRVALEGQLAAPRATARLLATLPLVGLGLGMMLGADPLGWLLGGPLGWASLTAGLVLTGLGLLWTGRIAAGVERLL